MSPTVWNGMVILVLLSGLTIGLVGKHGMSISRETL